MNEYGIAEEAYASGWRDGFAQAFKEIQVRQLEVWHAIQRVAAESLRLDDFIVSSRTSHPTAEELAAQADFEARGVDPY